MKALRLTPAHPNRRSIVLYLLIAILASLGIYMSIADSVTNPSVSQPIEVDGTTTPGEYSSSQPSGTISGSLYQSKPNDPKTTNIYTAVSGFVLGERNRKLIGKIESELITSVAPNSEVADITLPVIFNNAPTFALLQIATGNGGAFIYYATIDDDGVIDNDPTTVDVVGSTYVPSKIGMNLAAKLTSTPFFSPPHLVVEFAVSEDKARAVFRSGQVEANFYKPNGDQIQVVDALVSVDAGANTNTNTDELPILVDISMASTIDLQKNGNIPLTVSTTTFFDAQTIDPASVRLYPSSADSDLYPAGGAAPANFEDVLKPNGQRDLRLFFTTDALRAAGFTSGTETDVVLVAMSNDGTQVFGFTTVKTTP